MRKRVVAALRGVAALFPVATLLPVATLFPVATLLACGRADEPVDVPAPDPVALQELASLGYVETATVRALDVGKVGVTVYDPQRSQPGYNLFSSRNESRARLMSPRGEVVHHWARAVEGEALRTLRTRLPDLELAFLEGWNHVELMAGGDLLVIASHHALLRLDPRSRPRWQRDAAVHHDLDVDPDGRIHVLTDAPRSVRLGVESLVFQDALIEVLDPDSGATLDRISIFDAFRENAWRDEVRSWLMVARAGQREKLERLAAGSHTGDAASRALRGVYGPATRGEWTIVEPGVANIVLHNGPEDVFHANSIQVLREDRPGLWRRGDWLVSLLRPDLFVVIDHQTRAVTNAWGRGFLEAPHHATALAGGTILGFDNGVRRKYSRVVELDPLSGRIVWQYRGSPVHAFYSHTRGGCQPLANGNVLVTESNAGRAFEVTRAGEIVWEYFDESEVEGDEGPSRGAIYRMTRIGGELEDALVALLGRDAVSAVLDVSAPRTVEAAR